MNTTTANAENVGERTWSSLRELHEEQISLLEAAVQLALQQRERIIAQDVEGMASLFQQESEVLQRLRSLQMEMEQQAQSPDEPGDDGASLADANDYLQEERLRLASLARREFAINAQLMASGLDTIDHYFRTVAQVVQAEMPAALDASPIWLDESA